MPYLGKLRLIPDGLASAFTIFVVEKDEKLGAGEPFVGVEDSRPDLVYTLYVYCFVSVPLKPLPSEIRAASLDCFTTIV